MMNDEEKAMAIDHSEKLCKLDALEGLFSTIQGPLVKFKLDYARETVTVIYPRSEREPDVVNIAADSPEAMVVDIFLQAGKKILAKA